MKRDSDFLRQAVFLRSIAEQIKNYDANGTKYGIAMDFLVKTINETADECMAETNAEGHMNMREVVDALAECVTNNSNLESDDDDSPLFRHVHKINRYADSSFTVCFADGVSYKVNVTVI